MKCIHKHIIFIGQFYKFDPGLFGFLLIGFLLALGVNRASNRVTGLFITASLGERSMAHV